MSVTNNKDEIRDRLTGPFPSVKTPFKKDGDIDYDGLRNQIEFDIAAGSKTIMLTAGDSHFICMSRDEIADVTKAVCDQVGGRAAVVAADCYYATSHAIEFANFAKECGADMVMILPPNWTNSSTPESLAEHYAAIAEHMPVMIVTNIFVPLGIDFGLEAIRRALELSDGIVAIKDDMCGDFAKNLCELAHDRCAILAGGQKSNHMNMWKEGCVGYLSSFISFHPEIAWKYWNAIEACDFKAANKIINEIDKPFFDFIIKEMPNWNAAMHGVLELFGISKRWRRKPYHTLSDEEMERLRRFLQDKKILGENIGCR